MSSSWWLSWCLKLSCDVSWCLVVSDAHLMMFHVSSWSWLTSYDTFFWCRSCCLMVSNVLWCLITFHGASFYVMMFMMCHAISWCLKVSHDVWVTFNCFSQCLLMSCAVSCCLGVMMFRDACLNVYPAVWCRVMSYPVSWHPMISHDNYQSSQIGMPTHSNTGF